MQRRIGRLGTVVAVILAGLLTGCASSTGPRDTLGWMQARGADFMDIFGIRVAVGPGLGAYARVTQYAQFGFTMRGPSETYLPKPEDVQLRSVPCVVVGTIGRYGGAWFDSTREVMLPGWSLRQSDTLHIHRQNIAGYVSPHGEYDNWELSIGAGVHFLLVGAEAELRPLEILDFVAGLLGYDPSEDDVPVAVGWD